MKQVFRIPRLTWLTTLTILAKLAMASGHISMKFTEVKVKAKHSKSCAGFPLHIISFNKVTRLELCNFFKKETLKQMFSC